MDDLYRVLTTYISYVRLKNSILCTTISHTYDYISYVRLYLIRTTVSHTYDLRVISRTYDISRMYDIYFTRMSYTSHVQDI